MVLKLIIAIAFFGLIFFIYEVKNAPLMDDDYDL